MKTFIEVHPHRQLPNLVKQGARPVIRFTSSIADAESYAEPGMMARVTGIDEQRDDVLRVALDYSEFEGNNLPLEQANYYDKDGRPTLTARQSGYYKQQDSLYLDSSGKFDPYFEFIDAPILGLFDRFRGETRGDDKTTYVTWLEKKLLAAEECLAAVPATKTGPKP